MKITVVCRLRLPRFVALTAALTVACVGEMGGLYSYKDSDNTGDAGGDFYGNPGELCGACDVSSDCGGPDDYCLFDHDTGEQYCGRACSSGGICPAGFACFFLERDVAQCIPESNSCTTVSPTDVCEPACPDDQVCIGGQCVDPGEWDAALQHCVDEINRHRASRGRAALGRSLELEVCASAGAKEDAGAGVAHGHFKRTSGCNFAASAENEIPGWQLSNYGSIEAVITAGTQMMMNEGPGGGHHDAIVGDYTHVGCGIFVMNSGAVWVVQNFH